MRKWDYKNIEIFDIAQKVGFDYLKPGKKLYKCINSQHHKNGDKAPSLSIRQDGYFFNCFTCGIKGNVVEFAKISLNMDKESVFKWLKKEFPSTPSKSFSEASFGTKKKPEIQKFIDISSLEGMLGKRTDDIFSRKLLDFGMSEAHLKSYGVAYDCKNQKTMFFYKNLNGRFTNIKRVKFKADLHRDKSDPPRFLSEKDGYKINCLYGEHLLKEAPLSKSVILVESEKTAVIGSFIEKENIWLATGGATHFNEAKAHVLKGRKVIIAFDADDAGRRAAIDAKKILDALSISATIFDPFGDLDNGFDLADIFLDNLQKRILNKN
ncbi:MAG: toprim domain-containing protein [Calditrichae bacterium]|nr:toprim domain-containing protein [Calditrichia bacterium]